MLLGRVILSHKVAAVQVIEKEHVHGHHHRNYFDLIDEHAFIQLDSLCLLAFLVVLRKLGIRANTHITIIIWILHFRTLFELEAISIVFLALVKIPQSVVLQ